MPNLRGLISGVVSGDDLEITRTISNIPSGQTLGSAWFTVKENPSDPDSDAKFQKVIGTANAVGTGQITDPGSDATGTVRFDLGTADTGGLDSSISYYYDIQLKTSGGKIYTPEKGRFVVSMGVTST